MSLVLLLRLYFHISVFNLFIASFSSCSGCLEVCGQLSENATGMITGRGREEGKSTGPAAAGSDTRGVDGWGVGEQGVSGRDNNGQGKEGDGTGKGKTHITLKRTVLAAMGVDTRGTGTCAYACHVPSRAWHATPSTSHHCATTGQQTDPHHSIRVLLRALDTGRCRGRCATWSLSHPSRPSP